MRTQYCGAENSLSAENSRVITVVPIDADLRVDSQGGDIVKNWWMGEVLFLRFWGIRPSNVADHAPLSPIGSFNQPSGGVPG